MTVSEDVCMERATCFACFFSLDWGTQPSARGRIKPLACLLSPGLSAQAIELRLRMEVSLFVGFVGLCLAESSVGPPGRPA